MTSAGHFYGGGGPECIAAIDTCCGRYYYACATHPSIWARCEVCGEPRGDRKVRPVEWTGRGKAATFRYIEEDSSCG